LIIASIRKDWIIKIVVKASFAFACVISLIASMQACAEDKTESKTEKKTNWEGG